MSATRGDSLSGRPDAALFPARTERRRIDDYLTQALAAADERVCAGPATPTRDIEAFRRELESFDFATPRPLTELLDWSIGMLERGVTTSRTRVTSASSI